jgi:hypothetical protein
MSEREREDGLPRPSSNVRDGLDGGWGKAWPRERWPIPNRDAGQAMPRWFEPGHRLAAKLLSRSNRYLVSLCPSHRMCQEQMKHYLILSCLVWSTAGCLFGQEPVEAAPPTGEQKARIEAALKLTSDAANEYEIVVEGREGARAKLLPQPVLRWSNPVVGEIYGNVFLWTIDKRPTAIGSFFKFFSPLTHSSHEFHSLAESPLTARYAARAVWEPKQPGVKFLPLEGAELAAAKPAKRLIQMRQLSKRFTGRKTERDNEQHELRLLTQPIYRYDAASAGVVDGALFVFVQGTDPEVFLLLEAREPAAPAWHFAAARMNNVAMTLKFDDRVVWTVPTLEWNVAFDRRQAYTILEPPGK